MKDDLFEKTKFEHNFNKEFFPPLYEKEKIYIMEQIFIWYQKYGNINLEYFTDEIKKQLKSTTEEINYFANKRNDDYEFIVEYLFLEKLEEHLVEEIKNMSTAELINWAPKKGVRSWLPPSNKFDNAIQNTQESIKEKILIKVNEMIDFTNINSNFETEDNIKQTDTKELTKEEIIENKIEYLKDNKSSISKKAVDKLIRLYYKNTFTFTIKRSVRFQNELYEYLKEEFGINKYYKLLETTINQIDHFIDLESEKKLKIKMKDIHWKSFIHLMKRYYNAKTIEELKNEKDDIVTQTLNFYITMIVNINLKNRI